MQFKIPQFLERQPLIVGIAILISFYLHSVAPFFVFLISSTFLMSSAFCLAFIKVEGIPLPEVIMQSFGFVLSPKIYLWKKKENLRPIKLKSIKEKQEEVKSLKVSPKSILKELHSKIEGGY
jgi:hypothetical protein